MTIAVGDKLPGATLSRFGDKGPEMVELSSLTEGKKIVLFGLPGAFTRTCSATHLPSFVRMASQIKAQGVDHIVCISVNDPFVMRAWDDAHGAAAAGVELLADGDASLTKALGLDFTNAALGFIDRCKRFSAFVDDGEVKILKFEDKAGVCEMTAGETMLELIEAL